MPAIQNAPIAGVQHRISKTFTFTGLTLAGLVNENCTFFTVTGEVLIDRLVPYCTVDLASADAATITLGITGSTSLFLGATTATTLDVGDFWVNTTPVAAGVALPAAFQNIIITADILGAVATGTISSGAVRFDVIWTPLSPDASLT